MARRSILQKNGVLQRRSHNVNSQVVGTGVGGKEEESSLAAFEPLGETPHPLAVRELEEGFPHLPAGCTIHFEQKARQYVLENIKQCLPRLDRESEIVPVNVESLQSIHHATSPRDVARW